MACKNELEVNLLQFQDIEIMVQNDMTNEAQRCLHFSILLLVLLQLHRHL
jgi:hypothetical protein